MRKKNGITLIALVITIIILLILAGVSITTLTGDNGILNKAQNAANKINKEIGKEEVELAVEEAKINYYQSDAKENLKKYIINYLKNYKTQNGKITCNENGNVIYEGNSEILTGTIDDKGKINWGTAPIITAKVITEGAVTLGNSIKIEVKAIIKEAKVEIKEAENATLENKTKETDLEKIYIYTVNENGNYTFVANSSDGGSASTTVKVNQIIDKPKIVVSENLGTAITVKVENDYPEEANVIYSYYLNKAEKISNTTEKRYKMEGLTEKTQYTVKVVINYNGATLESEEIKVTTKGTPMPPKTTMISLEENPQKTTLAYPMLTLSGMMNCMINCNVGDRVRIEMEDKEDITNYYSIDGGGSWEKYTGVIEIDYPGEGLLKAKAENDAIGRISRVKDIVPYACDENIVCTGNLALKNEAYDRDYSTYTNVSPNVAGGDTKFQVSSECWGGYIHVYCESADSFYGVLTLGSSQSNPRDLVNGFLNNNSGLDGGSLVTKSVLIPERTLYGECSSGTWSGVDFNIYEMWCSDENLTGTLY